MRERYEYAGAVKDCFGNILSNDWRAETFADSQSLARRNLLYQFKKRIGLSVNNRIILCGNIHLSKHKTSVSKCVSK